MTHPVRDLSARTPLRVKLVATVVALAALALALAAVSASAALHGYLQQRVDQQLTDSLSDQGALQRACSSDRPQGAFGRPQSFGAVYVQLGDQSCPLSPGIAPPRIPARVTASGRPFTVGSSSGHDSWRAVAVAADRAGTVLVVAVPLRDVESTVHRLELIELIVGLGVLILLAGAGFLLVRRSLRPLVAVETTAEQIAAGNLSLRVPQSDPRTEVGRLSGAFNAMLGQIEQAFREREASEGEARQSEGRMRQFVADASHELRTPLTSIRGFAELYRQGALTGRPAVDRAMSRVESEAARMGLLVEDLLLLARLDQQRPLEQRPVDLLELASDAVADARATDPGRSVELVADSLPREPVVQGDAGRLRQVFGNLLTNALVHTPAGAPVVVRVRTTPFDAFLEVTDSGPGIPAHDRLRVFERFFRADASRTRAAGGSGLGLSIVAALVSAHGGSVEVVETPGGGATFRVRLPLPGDA